MRLHLMIFLLLLTTCSVEERSKPRVSIITSIWNGDEFIQSFMEDTIAQTIFPESELILINANSPGHEEEVITPYLKKYPNIRYIKLEEDPGLYAVWNYGIKLATADLITNANIDDRSRNDALEEQVKELESTNEIDLVYMGYLITEYPNETFAYSNFQWVCDPAPFSKQNMQLCLPGPRPVWRKSLHEKYGYFDESFRSAGDFEMWLRATEGGAQFKKLDGYSTLFYMNPVGISTDQNEEKSRKRAIEDERIIEKYWQIWQ